MAQPAASSTRFCRRCGASVAAGDGQCRSCGAAAAGGAAARVAYVRCARCGTEFRGGARFCAACGATPPPPPLPKPPPPPPPPLVFPIGPARTALIAPAPRVKSGGSGCGKFVLFLIIIGIASYGWNRRSPMFPSKPFTPPPMPAFPSSPLRLFDQTTAAATSVNSLYVWPEPIVDANGWVGARFHASCSVRAGRGGRLALYFLDEYDRPLIASDPAFQTPARELAASTAFATSIAPDVAVFLPYEQLDLAPGRHALHVRSVLFADNGVQLTTGPQIDWGWQEPESFVTRAQVTPHAMTKLGNGSRILANFYCEPLASGRVLVTAHFLDPSGGIPVQGVDARYTDTNGKLAASTPVLTFPSRHLFHEIELFLPDSALPGGRVRDLDAQIRLYDPGANQFLTQPLLVHVRAPGSR